MHSWPVCRIKPFVSDTNVHVLLLHCFEEMTWNVPFTNPLEHVWWGGLNQTQKQGANVIGFVDPEGEVWDCFQNHYDDYDWKDLVQYNLSEYYIALGWTKEAWDGKVPPPPSENTTWANLTVTEQSAAHELCFFVNTWDQVNMLNWTDSTIVPDIGVVEPVPSTTAAPVATTKATSEPMMTVAQPGGPESTTTLPV